MSDQARILTVLCILFLSLFAVSTALAQDTLLVAYQGRLTDNAGNPVTGARSVTFAIYNSGGISKWSETHAAVQISAGLFNVILGSKAALPDSVFNGDDRYLGIKVGSDAEMSPRTLLTPTPGAAVARRMTGDIATQPGVLMMKTEGGDSAIVLRAATSQPTSNDPAFGTGLDLYDQGPQGWLNSPLIRMGVEPTPWHSATIRMFNPQPEPPAYPLLEMATILNSGASIKMFNPQPEPPAYPVLEVSSGINTGASIRMFNPQPEPPASPLLEMAAGPTNGATIKMFNPQPEPPAAPVYEVSSGVNSGATIRLFNPQPEPPAHPVFEVSGGFNTGASIKMFNPQPEPPAEPTFEVASSQANGGSVRLRNEVSNDRCDWDAAKLTFVFETGSFPLSKAQISAHGYSFFNGGNVGIGTASPANILTVAQGTATDPIADAWTTYSSRRWKTNIQTIKDPLTKVRGLRGVTYDWKKDGKHDLGLIAEEVAEVVPEVVQYEENGVDARSVDYGRLVALLIEAVKELKAENDELKTKIDRISQLESQLSDLKVMWSQLAAMK